MARGLVIILMDCLNKGLRHSVSNKNTPIMIVSIPIINLIIVNSSSDPKLIFNTISIPEFKNINDTIIDSTQ